MLDEINRITKEQVVVPLGDALGRHLDAKDKTFHALREAHSGPQLQQNPPPTSQKDRI